MRFEVLDEGFVDLCIRRVSCQLDYSKTATDCLSRVTSSNESSTTKGSLATQIFLGLQAFFLKSQSQSFLGNTLDQYLFIVGAGPVVRKGQIMAFLKPNLSN